MIVVKIGVYKSVNRYFYTPTAYDTGQFLLHYYILLLQTPLFIKSVNRLIYSHYTRDSVCYTITYFCCFHSLTEHWVVFVTLKTCL